MTNNNDDGRERVEITTCPIPGRSGLRCGLPPRYAMVEIDHDLFEPVEEWLYQCDQGHKWGVEPEPTATPAWEFVLSARLLEDLEILAELEAKHRADPTAGWLPPGPTQTERQAQHRARKQAKRQARQERRTQRKLPPARTAAPPADRQLEMRRQ